MDSASSASSPSSRTGPAGSVDPTRRRRLVVAHPSPDVYGSDRQMLETVAGAVGAGWQVAVLLPAAGPLVPLLREAGATVRVVPFPVLRKALLSPRRLAGFVAASVVAVIRGARLLRRAGADAVLVNTITAPTWVVAARLARRPVLCHVHEAEEDQHRAVAVALAAPLLLAHRVVTNSAAARGALTRALPRLAERSVVVHNGVQGPAGAPEAPRPVTPPVRLALVGRLSPRKGIDVALDAVALLAADGVDARLRVCGTAFEGYDWYVEELRDRAARPDLAGRVELAGYVHPTWPELAAADVVLVPSRVEPFGNTAVEGMLARRPVVASRTQGLAEVLDDGRTGLLVAPGDAAALAGAVARLVRDGELAARLADAARAEALARFSTAGYRDAMVAQILATAGTAPNRGA